MCPSLGAEKSADLRGQRQLECYSRLHGLGLGVSREMPSVTPSAERRGGGRSPLSPPLEVAREQRACDEKGATTPYVVRSLASPKSSEDVSRVRNKAATTPSVTPKGVSFAPSRRTRRLTSARRAPRALSRERPRQSHRARSVGNGFPRSSPRQRHPSSEPQRPGSRDINGYPFN